MLFRVLIVIFLSLWFWGLGFPVKKVEASGIPVVDVSNLKQQFLQVQHMLQQIKHMEHQINNTTGARGLGSVINSAYDTVVSINQHEILQQAGLNTAAHYGLEGQMATLYDAANQNAAQWLGQSQKSLQQAQDRFTELVGLVAQVDASSDQKDVLDLQARISAEEVLLQNEMVKLSMLQAQAQARDTMLQQKKQQILVESGGSLPSISFKDLESQ